MSMAKRLKAKVLHLGMRLRTWTCYQYQSAIACPGVTYQVLQITVDDHRNELPSYVNAGSVITTPHDKNPCNNTPTTKTVQGVCRNGFCRREVLP